METHDTLIKSFHSDHYLQHNLKRFKHLESLNIDFTGKTLLELGAGIGDHTEFLLTQNISHIMVTDARQENLDYLRKRFDGNTRVDVSLLDMEKPIELNAKYDIVYCYGLLYHLSNPDKAIEFISKYCNDIALIETCVSFGTKEEINVCQEDVNNPSQAISGKGCRPTRIWIYNKLKKYFNHVYIPITQPDHEQFPIDWINEEKHKVALARSIFIASSYKLSKTLLSENLLDYQTRYKED